MRVVLLGMGGTVPAMHPPSFPAQLPIRFVENVRAHSVRRSQALILMVVEENPGPSLPESPFFRLLVDLLPPAALWLLSTVPLALFISMSIV